jgi:hypothetical protein
MTNPWHELERLLNWLPDNALVGFVGSMLFFVLAQAGLFTVCYAIYFSWTLSPLTLIGWGAGAVLFYRRFMR